MHIFLVHSTLPFQFGTVAWLVTRKESITSFDVKCQGKVYDQERTRGWR